MDAPAADFITFFVPGHPVTKKNAKHLYAQTKAGAAARRRAKEYADSVKWHCTQALVHHYGIKDEWLPVFGGMPVGMNIVAAYKGKRHHDAANIPEIICDALQRSSHRVGDKRIINPGLLFKDDRQVHDLRVKILFIEDEDEGPEEGVSVAVWSRQDEESDEREVEKQVPAEEDRDSERPILRRGPGRGPGKRY